MIYTQSEADAALNRLLSSSKYKPEDARRIIAVTMGQPTWDSLSAQLQQDALAPVDGEFVRDAARRFYKALPPSIQRGPTFEVIFLPRVAVTMEQLSGMSPLEAIRFVANTREPYALWDSVSIEPPREENPQQTSLHTKFGGTYFAPDEQIGWEDDDDDDDDEPSFEEPPFEGVEVRDGIEYSYRIAVSDGLEPGTMMNVIEWRITARKAGVVVATAVGDAYALAEPEGYAPYEEIPLDIAIDAADMISDRDVGNIRALYKAGEPILSDNGCATLAYLQVSPTSRGQHLGLQTLAMAAEKLLAYQDTLLRFAIDPTPLLTDFLLPPTYVIPGLSHQEAVAHHIATRIVEPLRSYLDSFGVELVQAPLADTVGANQAMYMIGALHFGQDILGPLPPEDSLSFGGVLPK